MLFWPESPDDVRASPWSTGVELALGGTKEQSAFEPRNLPFRVLPNDGGFRRSPVSAAVWASGSETQ